MALVVDATVIVAALVDSGVDSDWALDILDGHALAAVEVATGEQLWTLPTEGVEQLAEVDADTVVVAMHDRVDLVDRHTGTIVTPVHAPAPRAIQATGDGAFVAKTGATSVHRFQLEPLRRTWSLNLSPPWDATYAAIESTSGQTYVVATIANGETLVAFEVSERDDSAPPSLPSCDGAHPSWHLGQHTGWAGETVHATLLEGEQPQLWIGIPGRDPATTTFTVSARPLDTTGTARFSHFSDDWQQELLVDTGGRTAEGFPPHWVVAADLPRPGCWEIRIVGDQVDDTTMMPLPAASGANG